MGWIEVCWGEWDWVFSKGGGGCENAVVDSDCHHDVIIHIHRGRRIQPLQNSHLSFVDTSHVLPVWGFFCMHM